MQHLRHRDAHAIKASALLLPVLSAPLLFAVPASAVVAPPAKALSAAPTPAAPTTALPAVTPPATSGAAPAGAPPANEVAPSAVPPAATPPKLLPPIPQTAPLPTLVTAEGEVVPQTIVAPSGKTLTLKFNDEFDALTDKDGQPYIDRSKWQTTFWQGSSQRTLWGNEEAEYYTDKDYAGNWKVMPEKNGVLNPFSFETPGILTISATKVPQELWKKYWMGTQRCFSSGVLVSDHRYNFRYGYITGRFKLPPNRGAWPAFWLLGDDITNATSENQAHHWGPEVDLFEFFGHRPTKHSAGIIGVKGEKLPWHFGYNNVGFDITKDFHTWGLEWNEDNMIFTFDDKVWEKTVTPESFKHSMYLLVNLAVGGRWYSQEMTQAKTPAQPWEVDETSMPWKMQCDYVRVYQ